MQLDRAHIAAAGRAQLGHLWHDVAGKGIGGPVDVVGRVVDVKRETEPPTPVAGGRTSGSVILNAGRAVDLPGCSAAVPQADPLAKR